ncbi:MAG: hypothetical protein QI199_06925 [Candidatus Korarchaeota archaeon]|nr:hypothetical protein [Candidatus Korarchaeota archaeon]
MPAIPLVLLGRMMTPFFLTFRTDLMFIPAKKFDYNKELDLHSGRTTWIVMDLPDSG